MKGGIMYHSLDAVSVAVNVWSPALLRVFGMVRKKGSLEKQGLEILICSNKMTLGDLFQYRYEFFPPFDTTRLFENSTYSPHKSIINLGTNWRKLQVVFIGIKDSRLVVCDIHLISSSSFYNGKDYHWVGQNLYKPNSSVTGQTVTSYRSNWVIYISNPQYRSTLQRCGRDVGTSFEFHLWNTQSGLQV